MIPVNESKNHYINATALSFGENDLENPNRVAVSLVSGAVIMVYVKGTIDYAADGSFRRWTLKGYSTKLAANTPYYIYARLDRSAPEALITFSANRYALDGSIEGDSSTAPSTRYWYVRIGELTATDGTSPRELTYDSGLLGTDKGINESNSALEEMFELLKSSVRPLIRVKHWFENLTINGALTLMGNLIFGGKTLTGVATSEDLHPAEGEEDYMPNNSDLATSGYVDELVKEEIDSLDDKFLHKDKDDRSKGQISSDKGFEVGEYTEGVLGSGAAMYMDEHGSSHIVGDYLDIRKKATFTTISVQELKHVGGEIILSPAAMVCSKVEETVTGWKCYFNTTDADGRKIYNEFEVGDFARCQTFNLEKSKYYWRKVEAKEADYIVLSKSYCDPSVENDVPEVGDNISQCGNATDDKRQSAIILSAYGADAPSYKQYKGIDRFELSDDMLVTMLSPNGNVIKGNFVSESTGKSINDDIENIKVDWNKVLQQTDKEFTMWFFNYVPTMENMPAVEWTSDELKLLHEQDLFFNTSTDLATSGRVYRFEVRDGEWGWYDVTDADTIKALENAYKAQQTADSKIRNFVEQPVPPYDKGDRWCNATYGELYDNDDLVCIVPKAEGEVFDIGDWQPVSAVTHAYVKNLDGSIGLVAEGLNGVKAEVEASVKYVVDPETNEKVLQSGIKLDADEILFKGKVIIEGNFSVDEYGNITLNNLTANDGVFNGVINANGGTIGGFTIDGNTLYTERSEGNGRIVIEVGTNRGVFINNSVGEPLFVARNDSGTIMRLYSQGNDAKALELVCNAQGNGAALESVGNSSLQGRYGGMTTPHELVKIAGLALSARSGTTFHATSSDEIYSWTDFLVADGDIDLPNATECKGKILFVKAKGLVNCQLSNGGIVLADETSPVVVRNGNNHSLIYISNGEHWYEFYCG